MGLNAKRHFRFRPFFLQVIADPWLKPASRGGRFYTPLRQPCAEARYRTQLFTGRPSKLEHEGPDRVPDFHLDW